jgi:hypothetical protein
MPISPPKQSDINNKTSSIFNKLSRYFSIYILVGDITSCGDIKYGKLFVPTIGFFFCETLASTCISEFIVALVLSFEYWILDSIDAGIQV